MLHHAQVQPTGPHQAVVEQALAQLDINCRGISQVFTPRRMDTTRPFGVVTVQGANSSVSNYVFDLGALPRDRGLEALGCLMRKIQAVDGSLQCQASFTSRAQVEEQRLLTY